MAERVGEQGFEIRSSGTNLHAVSGELDLATASQLEQTLARVDPSLQVLVDVSGLTFCDSSGIKVFVETATGLSEGACLILHGVNGATLNTFRIVGMDEVENIHVVDTHAPS